MNKVLEFTINNMTYEIYETDEIEDDKCVMGLSLYANQKILLKRLNLDYMIRTLKHELTHIWLYEYGHNQQDKEFNYEDVCEIVACSNDFINDIVDKYKKVKKENK